MSFRPGQTVAEREIQTETSNRYAQNWTEFTPERRESNHLIFSPHFSLLPPHPAVDPCQVLEECCLFVGLY